MEQVKQVGILGCGWLGTKLALKLSAQNWNVNVSSTSVEGMKALKEKGLNSFQLRLSENSLEGDLAFFDGLDQLVISIPPKRTETDPYSQKIRFLLKFLQSKINCRVIFLSSTSVYGKKKGTYHEGSLLSPDTPSSLQLIQSEKMILESSNPEVVIRLGGLVGPDRNPIFKLYHKLIPNPDGVLNFIHETDAVEGIVQLLTHNELEGVFNLVSPHHPKRKDYYLYMANKFLLPTPKFAFHDPPLERRIDGSKIENQTSFSYQVDNLLI